MTGRLADLFRLAWGLLYWNTRKSWFQFRGRRSGPPCQTPSDSGRAFETGCEACLQWSRPAKFRRVCPLLVETPHGLRCSVNAPEVRPFWGRAFGYYGGTIAAAYLGAVLLVFVFLRTVGYPISVFHLAWPGSWHRVGEVRGWFFMERSQRAFAAGRPAEGMLYLTNAYEFDPANYTVAYTFAQKLQLGHPLRADEVYRRLMREHPGQRRITAQAWFRSLLSRGDFAGMQELAQIQVLEDPERASVWMRALVFSSRQMGNTTVLTQLLASSAPAVDAWRQLLTVELLLREGKRNDARAWLLRDWSQGPAYSQFYQIRELIAAGEGFTAIDLTGKYAGKLDDTARATLLLEAYAGLSAQQSLERLADSLLAAPLNAPTVQLFAAHLIRHPSPALLDRLFQKFSRDKVPSPDENLDMYLAMYCTAGVAGDWDKLHFIGSFIRRSDGSASTTLGLVESFFRGSTTHTRISGLLRALPMPLEVNYALLERYPGIRPNVSPKAL